MKLHSELGLITAVIVLGIGCAGAGLSSPEGWKAVKTKHVVFHTSMDEHQYNPTLTSLEYVNAALSISFFFKDMDLGPVDVIHVDPADFSGVFGYLRSGVALPSLPGGGRIGKNGLIVLRTDPDGNDSAEMLAHLYLHKLMPKAPLWLHEGFAAYLKSVDYKEGGGKRMGCFGAPGGSPDSYVTMQDLFTMSWEKYDTGPRSWFKGTGRVLVDYLFHADGGKNIATLPQMLNDISGGKASLEVVPTALGLSIDQLNNKVVEHGNTVGHAGKQSRGLCPIGFPIDDAHAPDTSRASEPVSVADMQQLIDALKQLPSPEGFPSWYPPEVLAAAGSPAPTGN